MQLLQIAFILTVLLSHDSTLRHLRDNGIAKEQIVELNFESMEFRGMSAEALYRYVKDRLPDGKCAYLFFDEIQRVDQRQDAVNSFRVDFDCDIYVQAYVGALLESYVFYEIKRFDIKGK